MNLYRDRKTGEGTGPRQTRELRIDVRLLSIRSSPFNTFPFCRRCTEPRIGGVLTLQRVQDYLILGYRTELNCRGTNILSMELYIFFEDNGNIL